MKIFKIARNTVDCETLENYEKGNNVWSGADVIIADKLITITKLGLKSASVISFQQFDAMKRLVVTQHALSYLAAYTAKRIIFR